jgi:DNA-binding NarL/FixJ family response regulator
LPIPFIPDERRREDLHITRRELEILELTAQGLSNREIAEKLFVSEDTIKTHSSRVSDNWGLDEGRKRCSSARNSAFSPDLLAPALPTTPGTAPSNE